MSGPALGVDVGTVRLGVAISEHVDLPAMPLQTVKHTNRTADVNAVVAIARERGAHTIVVGYPLMLSGAAGPAAEGIDRFIDALRSVFDGDVVAVDERLSSAAATKKLTASELSPSKRRRVVDQLAAVEILESYRARQRRGG